MATRKKCLRLTTLVRRVGTDHVSDIGHGGSSESLAQRCADRATVVASQAWPSRSCVVHTHPPGMPPTGFELMVRLAGGV